MGFIRHDAIVLTGRTKDIEPVHEKARAHFEGSCVHVSSVTEFGMNDTSSFLVAPDGSKEGWVDSDECDVLRFTFVEWLRGEAPYVDWIEVRFGGDESYEAWVRTPTDDEFRRVQEPSDA